MLESINIFEVSLTETIEYEHSHATSKLVTLDRDAAMERALTLYSELNRASYVDSYTIEVRGGVLGESGFDMLLYTQKVYLHDEEAVVRSVEDMETDIDDLMECIAREASKRRHVINGFGVFDVSRAV